MLNLIEYRSFRNTDPPKLLKLWEQADLGRGAATGVTCDLFEVINYSQPYFDPQGLIVACDGPNVVGFAHAGFGCNADESALQYDTGVICAVIVHPVFRRRGIATALIARVEEFLRGKGSSEIYAGQTELRDPFYFGLYGGSQPTGFLETDVNAAPFFTRLGYERSSSYSVFQRDLSEERFLISFRISNLRRKLAIRICEEPEHPTWWWRTRYGRLDALRFMLVPKTGDTNMGSLTAIGLDFYLPKWKERAIGISELLIGQSERRQGLAQLLLLEVIKQVRQEMVTRVEAHMEDANEAAVQLVKSLGFVKVDTGIVYRRS